MLAPIFDKCDPKVRWGHDFSSPIPSLTDDEQADLLVASGEYQRGENNRYLPLRLELKTRAMQRGAA